MINVCHRSVPEAGEGFVICTGDEGHVNALIANLVAVKNADGSYSLLQRTHLYLSFELVVCVRAELNAFHLQDENVLKLKAHLNT